MRPLYPSKKILTLALLALPLYPAASFAKEARPSAVTSSPSPGKSTDPVDIKDWDSNKDLRLDIRLSIETEKGPGTLQAELKMGLNYGEVGEIQVGGRKMTLAPNLTSGESEIQVVLYDLQGAKLFESKIPFNEKALLKAKLDTNPEAVTRVELNLRRI